MIESVKYLGGWTDYASFGVDTVTYYPFNLYAQTTYRPVLHTLQYSALALIVLSLFLPAIVSGLERLVFKLRMIPSA
jgi:hypothetical protein